MKEYVRNCPKCNKILKYSGYETHRVASKQGTTCKSCVEKTPEWRRKIGEKNSTYRKGKTYEELYGKDTAERLKREHSEKLKGRKRPEFSEQWRRNISESHKNSKAFQEVMQSEEYRHNRRDIAIRNAYNGELSIEEWESLQLPKRLYYLKVKSITNQQPLHLLEHYGKRGMAGDDGYHLDHIYPISLGFANNISAEKIGHISNLQMLHWKENLIKSNKIVENEK